MYVYIYIERDTCIHTNSTQGGPLNQKYNRQFERQIEIEKRQRRVNPI